MNGIIYIASVGIGLTSASFLNSLIWRLYHHVPLLKTSRSICRDCSTVISWYDNIPIFSFILLRGRCRHCHQSISWQYPIVEFFMAILFFFVTWFHIHDAVYDSAILIKDLFVIWVLVFIFVYDFLYMEVVDSVTLGAGFLLFVIQGFMAWVLWSDMLIGLTIAGGFFALQFFLSKGKWIGGGDIRIGILMGIILGWQLTLLALWFAYVLGAFVAVTLLIVQKKKMADEIAFGTYLTVATVIALFFGSDIIVWYWGLF